MSRSSMNEEYLHILRKSMTNGVGTHEDQDCFAEIYFSLGSILPCHIIIIIIIIIIIQKRGAVYEIERRLVLSRILVLLT